MCIPPTGLHHRLEIYVLCLYQVIQSVQGSFDFLQDSLLDSQAEQASKSSSAAAAPTPAESSPVGSGAVTSKISGASLGSQQMATSSLLGTSGSACDEMPMIDDPAVMHVTGGKIYDKLTIWKFLTIWKSLTIWKFLDILMI